MRVMILTDIPGNQDVWWEKYVKPFANSKNILMDFENAPDSDLSLFSWKTLLLLLMITAKYLKRYKHYDYLVTFQAGVSTAWIGILKRIFRRYNQKHIVLQFHRKEKDDSWKSRVIYFALKFALKSTDKIICSSRGEILYYKNVFFYIRG